MPAPHSSLRCGRICQVKDPLQRYLQRCRLINARAVPYCWW